MRLISHISRRSPYLLPTAVLIICLGAVPAAAMWLDDPGGPALSNGPTPTDGSPPEQVLSAKTNLGQSFTVKTFPADGAEGLGKVRCVVIAFSDAPKTEGPTLADGKLCLNADAPPVTAMLSELFVDPATGDASAAPQRFVYGTVNDQNSTRVVIETPDDRSIELDTVKVPGTDLEAFAGSLPPSSTKGSGIAEARNASGEVVGRQELTFGQLAKTEKDTPEGPFSDN